MATKTRWTLEETIAVARAEFSAAERHAARLAPRGVTAQSRAQLKQATDAAQAAASGQPVRLGAQKGKTAAVADVIARAQDAASAMRKAIRRVFPGRADLHRVFGVGGAEPKTVGGGLSAVDSVLQGAGQYPVEAAKAGILARDLERLSARRAELLAADTAQEGTKGQRLGGTASKDDLLRDLVRRVDGVIAAAELEFVDEPAVLAESRGRCRRRARRSRPVRPRRVESPGHRRGASRG